MRYVIKTLAVILAVITAVAFTGCGKTVYQKVEETATYNLQSGEKENGGNNFSSDSTIIMDDDGNLIVEDESEIVLDDNTPSENTVTTKKNNTVTTRPSTTRPTTTKATTTRAKTVTVPVGKSAIIAAYNTAANRTKAHNNMEVNKTNSVQIVIDDLAGNEFVTNLANSIASKYMKQYAGQTIREVYVNGKPTIGTVEKDLQYTDTLCNDKSLFIPVRKKGYMCSLRTSDVVSATATRLSASTYRVEIVLKSESTDLNTPPAIITRGMDYFEQKVFDLGGFRFTSGTAVYENCKITGIVNADGYLDYAENKMSVKSTDATVALSKLSIPAKLHGDYITTLKFKIK